MPNGAMYELRRFYYDTAQSAHAPAMSALAKVVPVSQIVFGTDYPYHTLAAHVKGLRESGVFTEEQAARGQQAYRQSCASCHLDDLLGERDAPPLAGAQFSDRWNGSTADDMLQTIRRTMPQEAPDSLGPQSYADIVSYLLQVNGSPAGDAELPGESSALQQIRITGRP